MNRRLPPAGLYAITPDWDDTDRLLTRAAEIIAGGAVMLQYRHKSAPTALMLEQAKRLKALCAATGTRFIVNDSVVLCSAAGADGVHLGRSNTSIAEARDRLGPDRIIGATCYGEYALATAAARDGADYIAFGGFFPSTRKDYPVTTPDALVRRTAGTLDMPIAVIGGMTADNAGPLVAAGARWVAAIGSIFDAPDGRVAASRFATLLASAPQGSTLGAVID